MESKKGKFENAGLKIDKDRVLTYSQLSCPLDCSYCFVDDMNFNQKKNVVYLTKKQIQLFDELPKKIKLIMLGCDTEFFQPRAKFLEILNRLVDYGKDISVVTKMSLSDDIIAALKSIDVKLNQKANFLTFSTTLTSLKSVCEIEPRAPAPLQRIETLKKVY